jgi:hypothetical protein
MSDSNFSGSVFSDIHSKFSVKYYLNLVLVDEEDRRYFKQQEIILWRRKAGAHTELDANPTGRHTGPRLFAEGKPARSKKTSGKKSSKKTDGETPGNPDAGAGQEQDDADDDNEASQKKQDEEDSAQ